MTSTPERTGDLRGRLRRSVGGLRLRIVVGYVVLLGTVLLISLIVTRQVLLSELDREVSRALSQEVEELRLLADGIDPSTGEPFADDVEAIFDTFLSRNVPTEGEAFYTLVGGEPYRSSTGAPAIGADDPLVTAWAAAERPTSGEGSTVEGDARYLAVPLTRDGDAAGVFAVVIFPEDDRDQLLGAIRTATIVGAVALVASAVLAWLLAGRILRPVREITATARAISGTDLSRRIPAEGNDELAELGRTFNDMLDRVEGAFGAQRQFLDDVAHELRTPITIAQGHLELLGYDDPDEQQQTVDIVTDELDRMNRYVGDLLVLAKSERPDFLRLGPVDVGELIESLRRRVATLGDRSWMIDSAPQPGVVAIVADEERLAQALLNLAANAEQHTADGDEIALGAEVVSNGGAGGAMVRLWVRDTGPGIEPDVADELFERRARGATSRARRPEGMGIGLSIVDAIARAHGGTARVDSVEGEGATFSLLVPMAPPAEEGSEVDREGAPS